MVLSEFRQTSSRGDTPTFCQKGCAALSPQEHPLVGYSNVKHTPVGYQFFVLSHSLWVIFVKFSYLATLFGSFLWKFDTPIGVKIHRIHSPLPVSGQVHPPPTPAASYTSDYQSIQRTYDVIITSLLRQNDVVTSFWRDSDVIITSCVGWELETMPYILSGSLSATRLRLCSSLTIVGTYVGYAHG